MLVKKNVYGTYVKANHTGVNHSIKHVRYNVQVVDFVNFIQSLIFNKVNVSYPSLAIVFYETYLSTMYNVLNGRLIPVCFAVLVDDVFQPQMYLYQKMQSST